jgi:putative flippase GtrA
MGGYAVVGGSTFLLDLALVFAFQWLGFIEYFSILLAFLIAVSVNFWFSYHYVFKGTERSRGSGYVFFLTIALVGVFIIAPGSVFLNQSFGINLYLARTIMGGLTGGMNFLLNNFLNFKMGLR